MTILSKSTETFRAVIITAFFMSILLSGLAEAYANDDKEIVFAAMPCGDPVKEYEQYYPLVKFIGKNLNQPVRLIIPRSVEEIDKLLSQGKIQFVLHSPGDYVQLQGHYKADFLLKSLTLEGNDTSRGYLVALADNRELSSVKDLKGKTVLFGPETSGIKWLAAENLLQEFEIDTERDLKLHGHGGCCPDILLDIYFKKFDAGFICEHGLEEMAQVGVDKSVFKIIARTEPFPNPVMAASKESDDKLSKEVEQLLLSLSVERLPEQQEILKSAGIGGFTKAKDSEYEMVRAMRKKLGY